MGYMENIAYFENDNWIEKTNIAEHIYLHFPNLSPFDYDAVIFI